MLGLDKLNEKAPTMPDVVKFDNIFSNDLEEENEYDLFFGAEEDDQLIEAIAQDELFDEAGYERQYISLSEEGEEDIEEEDGDVEDIDDKTSSDVDEDIDTEGEEPVAEPEAAPVPTVQVNVDADDVNINAEAPSNEAVELPNLLEETDESEDNSSDNNSSNVNSSNNNSSSSDSSNNSGAEEAKTECNEDVNLLDEDDISIDHAGTVNINTAETEDAPQAEPAPAPVPGNDEIVATAPTDSECPPEGCDGGEEPNLLDGDGEEETTDDGTSDAEEVPTDNEEPEDGSEEESPTEESVENLLDVDEHYDGAYAPFEDKANLAKTNNYDDVPYEEIPAATDTPNLLEEDADPTVDAPDVKAEMIKTPNPSMRDTSSLTGIQNDSPEVASKQDAMTTVDNLGISEGGVELPNLLEGEIGKEIDGILQADNPSDDTSMFSAIEKDPEFPVADALTDFSKIDEDVNLLEVDEDPYEAAEKEEGEASLDIAKAQNLTGGIDNLNNIFNGAPTFDDPDISRCQREYQDGSTPNLLEADADTNFDGIEEKPTENHFKDDLADPLAKDPGKVMNNSPEDTTKEEEGIKQLRDTENKFDDCIPGNDPSATMNNAAVDPTKKEEGIKQEEDTLDNFKDDLKEPLSKNPESIMSNAPEDSTKEDKGGLQEGVELPNLLDEEDASTNFDGIEKEEAPLKTNTDEVIPDQVAIPAADKDQDGLKAEVGGPKETGNDEKLNTVAEDYMEDVKAISSDDVFYDQINTGLDVPPVNLLDDDAEELVDDLAAEEA